ncbi:MAG: nicotinamidase/pyrazinamidase [Clostridia bacterium]|nr:nicotinamidase/pyrazinamidase [Clostridia bacterium]
MAGRALLVIDMLNDFASPGGALYVGDTVGPVSERIRQELSSFRAGGGTVIYICDRHRPDDAEFKMFKPHCIAGTRGAEVIEVLKPQEGEIVIPKRRYSAFYGTELDLFLREKGIKEIVLTGVCTNICVLYTAADARMRGYEVTVLAGAVTSFDAQAHAFALAEMEHTLGAKLEP